MHIRIGTGPFSVDWIAQHCDYRDGESFVDVQKKGPFKHWRHTHTVLPIDAISCTMEDKVEYVLPGGGLINRMARSFVEKKLTRMFTYRHAVLRNDQSALQAYPLPVGQRINIGPAGSSAVNAAVSFFQLAGHFVELVDHPSGAEEADSLIWFGPPSSVEQPPPCIIFACSGDQSVPKAPGSRVTVLKHGVLLSPSSGLLATLLPLFRKGLGGTLGSWNQRLAWLAFDDLLYNMLRALSDQELDGMLDLSSPQTVPCEVFSTSLANVLGRPILLPWPKWLRKFVLGRELMGEIEANLFAGSPPFHAGGHYTFVDLDNTLRHYLGKASPRLSLDAYA